MSDNINEDEDEKAEVMDEIECAPEPVNKKQKPLPIDFTMSMANEFDDDSASDSDGETEMDKTQAIRDELALYLNEKYRSKREKMMAPEWTTNPLKYWESRAARFPYLSTLARRVLVVRVSQAPTESVFSVGGFLLGARKHNLSSQRFGDIMVLHSHYSNMENKEENLPMSD